MRVAVLRKVFGLRAVALVPAALCFWVLLLLGQWSTHYASSDAWADTVKKQRLDWSEIVGIAAERMPKPQSPPYFQTDSSFYRALLAYIKGGDSRTDSFPVKLLSPDDQLKRDDYRALLSDKKGTQEALAGSGGLRPISLKGNKIPRNRKKGARPRALVLLSRRISSTS